MDEVVCLLLHMKANPITTSTNPITASSGHVVDMDILRRWNLLGIGRSSTMYLPPPKTMTSAQEYLKKLLPEVDVSRFCEETYFLPFQIESLTLNNIGPFEKFEAHFHRNSVNVIYGPGGSGKSMVLRSILLAFGTRHRFFSDRALGGGRIELKIFSDQDSIKITAESHGNITKGYQCLLIDVLLEPISRELVPVVLNELNNLGIQVVITARARALDLSMLQANAYVISLENL